LGIINFLDFNSVGARTSDASTAYKRIQRFSKVNPQLLFGNTSDYSLRYNKLANLYFNETEFLDSSSHSTSRQHNFLSSKALTTNFISKVDNDNLDMFFKYNFNYNQNNNKVLDSVSPQTSYTRMKKLGTHTAYKGYQRGTVLSSPTKYKDWENIINSSGRPKLKVLYKDFLTYPTRLTFLDANSSSKSSNNPFGSFF